MKTYSANSKKRKSLQKLLPLQLQQLHQLHSQHLFITNIAEFLIANNLGIVNELMGVAKNRYEDGKKDIYHFVLSKNQKASANLVTTAWPMKKVSATVQRANKPQLDNLKDHLDNRCTKSCSAEWFRYAKEVLVNNGQNRYTYADAVRKCLDRGR